MKEELKRKENETKLQYFKRITDNRKELDIDYAEWSSAILGEERYGSENSRKMFYMVEKLLKQIDEEQVNNISDNEILKEIEEKTKELEIMKIQYRDMRREYNKYLRDDARWRNILDIVSEGIKNIKTTKQLVRYDNICKTSSNNEAVLICSDWHTGAKFNNVFGQYNYEIEKKRVNELLSKTIEYCKTNDVKTLHLELLGDMLSGAIHISSKVEAEEDVISQLMFLMNLLEDFINELSNNIEEVKVYTSIGNHSRIFDFDKNQEGENFERLIPFYLSKRFEGVSNIHIMKENNVDDHITLFEVKGMNIIGVHGDLDKPNKVVDNMIKMLKVIPEEFHIGHFHSDFEKTEYDIELCVNGSLQGTDSYAKRIRKTGKPMQKLRIYNDEGCLMEYKIKL